MDKTRRERLREATIEEILSTAWKQIGEEGASGLSLRAIAREMGMTAPALYRYFNDRDALVTTLLIDAFNSFCTALEIARDNFELDEHVHRFRAICKAYFYWGLKNQQKYLLLFGTPITGYQLSKEVIPSARKSFLVLQGVIGEANIAGKIVGEVIKEQLPNNLKSQYETLQTYGMPYTPNVTHLALSTWNTIHGLTSLFLYGYSQGFLGEQIDSFVECEIERIVKAFGFE